MYGIIFFDMFLWISFVDRVYFISEVGILDMTVLVGITFARELLGVYTLWSITKQNELISSSYCSSEY
jgi:hypothetical protein